MFFSTFELFGNSLRHLGNRNLLHMKLMAFFPSYRNGLGSPEARSKFGILFRVEGKTILLSSRIPPEFPASQPGYLLFGTKDLTQAYAEIRNGDSFEFRLDANTSIAEKEEESAQGGVETKTRGKRVGCRTYPAREQWLKRMAERSGFVPGAFSMKASLLRIKGGVLEVTRFDGRLEVKDAGSFLESLCEGVGRGKSYGLGMISIQRP